MRVFILIADNSKIVIRTHIGHTATTIDIVNGKVAHGVDYQQDAFGMGHIALITSAIEIAHRASIQMP